jgi:phage gp16-like protein
MNRSSDASWRERPINNRKVALVHVAKARLGLDDATYRAMLASVGVGSSKDLNQTRFDELMKRFEAGGFKSRSAGGGRQAGGGWGKSSTRASAAKSGMDKPAPEDKRRLLAKIEAILAAMGLPWAYADAIAKNVCGVDKVRWCDNGQLYKVAQVLAIYQRRKTGTRGKRLTHGVNKTSGGATDGGQG